MARKTAELVPLRVALLIMWAVVVGAVLFLLLTGVRSTDSHSVLRHVLHATYVAILLWNLTRTGTSVSQLPELDPQVLPRWCFGPWIPVTVIALMLVLSVLSDDGIDLLMIALIGGTLWILFVWRREIRVRFVVQGLALALVAYAAVRPAMNNGLIGSTTAFLLPLLSAPMYVAGVLLLGRTRLGGTQLHMGRYREALKSFLVGCVLFVPLGLINAADGSPGTDITWVTEWWMPVTLPWFSGLTEEVLFRLLLVGLCYFLLRPAFRTRPALAVVAAVLFSAITFGLGHGRTLERFLTTGLLYGLPMAALFAKRDWEHAAGAHYMVNMIPWTTVFLEA